MATGGARVVKVKLDGDEEQAGGIGGSVVHGVAEDGAFDVSEVGADLVFAAGVEGDAEEGAVGGGFQSFVVSEGALAAGARDVDGAVGVFGEEGFDFARRGFGGRGDDREIDTLNRVMEELFFE